MPHASLACYSLRLDTLLLVADSIAKSKSFFEALPKNILLKPFPLVSFTPAFFGRKQT